MRRGHQIQITPDKFNLEGMERDKRNVLGSQESKPRKTSKVIVRALNVTQI